MTFSCDTLIHMYVCACSWDMLIHVYVCDIMCHDSLMCVMTHLSDMRHDAFMECVAVLVNESWYTWHEWVMSQMRWMSPWVTRLTHVICGMMHSMCRRTRSCHVWHDSFMSCVTWLIHVMCDMTRQETTTLSSHMWLLMCSTWLMHMCDMTHACLVTWLVTTLLLLVVWHTL